MPLEHQQTKQRPKPSPVKIGENRIKLIWFVLEQAEKQPVEKRVELYRSLADIVGDEKESNFLNTYAEELERSELKGHQFMIQFQQKCNFHGK